MNINISAVSGRREAEFPFSFEEKLDGLSGYSQAAVFTTPVSLDGEVIKDGDIYYISGKGSVGVSMPCDRCLEPVSFSVDFELDLYALNFLYTPRSKHPSKEQRIAYYNTLIRPDKFTDTVILEMPYGMGLLNKYAMHNGLERSMSFRMHFV